MSDYQIFSNYLPLANAGVTVKLTPTQDLGEGGADRLKLEGPAEVNLLIEGPRLRLTPADIAGVYPAPGSEESPDEFLPHIALERRTLPWERAGPEGEKCWLALLLLTESELRGAGADLNSPASTLEAVKLKQVKDHDEAGYGQLIQNGLNDETPLNVIYLKNSVWWARRPRLADLKYMCHVRQDLAEDKYRAIVISYRLPNAGEEGAEPENHTALLISLEQRDDLYDSSRSTPVQGRGEGEAVLVVLHHWTFRPSTGGDFEQVIRSIGYRPNGGVLRFGNLPKDAEQGDPETLSGDFRGMLDHAGYFREPLPHTQPGEVTWRGPLRPFKPPARTQGFAVRAAPEEFEEPKPGDPLDYSHATAFELGRLLAFARPEVLEDLRGVRPQLPPIEVPDAINKLPVALQKKDWVTNPAWDAFTEDAWSMELDGQFQSLVKGESELLDKGVADVGGIAEQRDSWLDEVAKELEVMNEPVSAPIGPIATGTTAQELGNMFPDLKTFGESS